MKKVLVLGAGLVARPLLEDLDRRGDIELVVAALNGERAQELAASCQRAQAVELDTDDQDKVAAWVAKVDLVVANVGDLSARASTIGEDSIAFAMEQKDVIIRITDKMAQIGAGDGAGDSASYTDAKKTCG